MLRRIPFLILLCCVALLSLQIAASWHSAEHVQETKGNLHSCSLCLLQQQPAMFAAGLILVAVAIRQTRLVRPASARIKPFPSFKQFCCRDPPSIR